MLNPVTGPTWKQLEENLACNRAGFTLEEEINNAFLCHQLPTRSGYSFALAPSHKIEAHKLLGRVSHNCSLTQKSESLDLTFDLLRHSMSQTNFSARARLLRQNLSAYVSIHPKGSTLLILIDSLHDKIGTFFQNVIPQAKNVTGLTLSPVFLTFQE